MAALRCAARRFVGLRTRAAVVSAAVQTERRRFVPRLIHSGPPAGFAHPATSNCMLAHPPNGNSEVHQIQQELRKKKEEMYNLLAEVERNKYYTDSGARVIRERYQNIRLLRHLSVQVDPKPKDYKWCFYQMTHKFMFYWIYGAFVITSCSIRTMLHADRGEDEALKVKKIALGGTSTVEEPKAHTN